MDESFANIHLVVIRLGRKLKMYCVSLTSSIKVWILYIYFCSFFFFPSFCASCRRQYHPLSLQRLQYLIDLGRVDPTQPIDLTQLTNARGVTVQPLKRDYGVQLVEEVGIHYRYIASGSVKPWVFSFFYSRLSTCPALEASLVFLNCFSVEFMISNPLEGSMCKQNREIF